MGFLVPEKEIPKWKCDSNIYSAQYFLPKVSMIFLSRKGILENPKYVIVANYIYDTITLLAPWSRY